MDSDGSQSSSLQGQDIPPKIKEVILEHRRQFVLHWPCRDIYDISASRSSQETALHYRLKYENHELLESFAEAALPLYFSQIKLYKTVEENVSKLSEELKHYDRMVVKEALKSYVEDKMNLAKKEKQEFKFLTEGMLSKLGKESTGYAEAKKYFSVLKKEYNVAINGILDWAEVNLKEDDKKEIYNIQKQLESDKSFVRIGPEYVFEVLEMELDPQLSEANKRNEIGSETLAGDKAIKRRRTESTSNIMSGEHDGHNTTTKMDP